MLGPQKAAALGGLTLAASCGMVAMGVMLEAQECHMTMTSQVPAVWENMFASSNLQTCWGILLEIRQEWPQTQWILMYLGLVCGDLGGNMASFGAWISRFL